MPFGRDKDRERDLDRELRDHLELEAQEQRESGMPGEEADYAARRALGNVTLIKEQVRETRPFAWLEALKQDARYSARMLRKNPGFAVAAICTLALGIGANTALFSVVNAVLLNPLPYPDASRLVVVWEQNASHGFFRNVVSAANFRDWKRQNHVFSDMAALFDGTFDLSGVGEPVEVRGELVSGNFLAVLGVRPALGRGFTPEDDHPGSRVVLLSHALWIERFGGDPSLIGRQIAINRAQFTVIGVLPPAFYFPPWQDSAQRARFWVTGLDLRKPERTWHNYESFGRLKPGVTLDQARVDMAALSRQLGAQYPEQKDWAAQLISVHDQVVGDTRPALLELLAAVGMVLLIACANLANLQLARVAAREKEIAVRAALGGGRFRVIRQVLIESVLLAVTGGNLGVLLAAWGVKVFVAYGPRNTPGLSQATLNVTVLWFTLILSVVCGIVFGLIPALNASKTDLLQCMNEGSRGSTQGLRSRRLRGMLVASEFALALVLLAGAGLLIRSFAALSRVNLGFDPHHVVTMRIALTGRVYADNARQGRFFENLLPRVQPLPGVTSAAVIDQDVPFGGSGMDFLIEGRPVPPSSEWPDASVRSISADYFRALRIPLLRGRSLAESDNETAPRVAVINERLAREYWPGQNPIGSRIRFPGLATSGGAVHVADSDPIAVIVGVVKTVRNLGVDLEGRNEIYVPYKQLPVWFTPRTLLVRMAGDPAAAVSAIRRNVQALDPDQPISNVTTVDETLTQAEAGHRFPMLLLSLFAALALALAAIGIYGVMSYSVAQRTREIGVRMALGAQRGDVIQATVTEGMRVAAIGVAFGLAGALGLTRLLSGLLFGTGSKDPLTFFAAPLLLLAIGFAAIVVPARRASKIDPNVALRYE